MDTTEVIVIYFFISIIIAFLIAELGKSRTIGYWGAFFITLFLSPLIGLLFVGFSTKKVEQMHRYKAAMEKAKKEEFKGNIKEAIDKYQDTLFYLKNDYQNINSNWKESHQNLVNKIQRKIEELKTTLIDTNKLH